MLWMLGLLTNLRLGPLRARAHPLLKHQIISMVIFSSGLQAVLQLQNKPQLSVYVLKAV